MGPDDGYCSPDLGIGGQQQKRNEYTLAATAYYIPL
jgi:hypothetical protein